jgi:hypothetical protein
MFDKTATMDDKTASMDDETTAMINTFLLAGGLTVFQLLGLEIGVGIGIAVASLLELFLGEEQVGHLGRADAVVVAIQAEVFLRLCDGVVSNDELLVAGLDGCPGVIHADDEFLAVVLQLVLSIFQREFLLLDGV